MSQFNGFSDSDMSRVVGKEFSSKVLSNRVVKNGKKDSKPRKAIFIPEEAKLSTSNKKEVVGDCGTDIVVHLHEQPIIFGERTETAFDAVDHVSDYIDGTKPLNSTPEPIILRSNIVEKVPKPNPEESNVNHRNVNLPSLDQFEEKRKELEDKNEQAKKDLVKALHHRAKKTKEEVKKLNEIERELNEIDNVLSSDIAIIRDQIECASHYFMEAQKRFDRAEKEYNIALADLMKAKEKKMLLTSHLCSIIEQNELKKAQKLSDLMEKMEISFRPNNTLFVQESKMDCDSAQEDAHDDNMKS